MASITVRPNIGEPYTVTEDNFDKWREGWRKEAIRDRSKGIDRREELQGKAAIVPYSEAYENPATGKRPGYFRENPPDNWEDCGQCGGCHPPNHGPRE